ncbi:MAG: hypothetical protein IKY42_00455 [Bacteroidaceae bacterium]|nr:hypothetical protein [Bacteroidaceae bacterium]
MEEKTFFKVEINGNNAHAEYSGKGIEIASALANAILDDEKIRLIALCAMAAAIHEQPDLLKKLEKIAEVVNVDRIEEQNTKRNGN